MELLLLGGPRFLGHALIEAALASGHKVTMFNRGRSNPHLFPQVERLTGDRDEYKSVGNLDDVIGLGGFMILPGLGLGLLVEQFGFNRNVGFTLWWALWGLLGSIGVALFFVAATDPPNPPPGRPIGFHADNE